MKRTSLFWHLFLGVLFFGFGYGVFWIGGVRIGFHPYAWRQAGALKSFDYVLDTCTFPNDQEKLIPCLRAGLRIHVLRWGLHELMVALERRQMTANTFDISRVKCHDIGHQLAETAVSANVSMQAVLHACTNVCQSGCFHGAVSREIRTGNIDLLSSLFSFCHDISDTTDERFSCLHGVGHAIVDLVGANVSKALSYCDSFPFDERQYCGQGVFMELTQSVFAKNPLNTNMPPMNNTWCADMESPYDGVCFILQGVTVHQLTHEREKAILSCHNVPEEYRTNCLIGVGKSLYFTYPLTKENDMAIKNYCDAYVQYSYDFCVSKIRYNAL